MPEAQKPEFSLEADWEELRRLAEKHRKADDPDISRALEAILVSKAQSLALSAKSRPAWLSEFPLLSGMFSTLSEDGEGTPTHATDQADQPDQSAKAAVPNDLEAAERFIREAHIASMRSDKVKAKELLDRAEQAAPTSAPVLAALGDSALERHNVKEAIRLYAAAMEAEPGNIALERKHADAVFRQAQGSIFDPTAHTAGSEAVAGAKAGVIMSVMLPGLGQIVTGETSKGVGIMAVWIGSWIWALLIGIKGLFGMIGLQASKEANPMILVPLGIAIVFHLVAIFDATAKAKTIERRKIQRPVPPANLPFE